MWEKIVSNSFRDQLTRDNRQATARRSCILGSPYSEEYVIYLYLLDVDYMWSINDILSPILISINFYPATISSRPSIMTERRWIWLDNLLAHSNHKYNNFCTAQQQQQLQQKHHQKKVDAFKRRLSCEHISIGNTLDQLHAIDVSSRRNSFILWWPSYKLD